MTVECDACRLVTQSMTSESLTGVHWCNHDRLRWQEIVTRAGKTLDVSVKPPPRSLKLGDASLPPLPPHFFMPVPVRLAMRELETWSRCAYVCNYASW